MHGQIAKMQCSLAVQVGSEHQDLLVVLEGTVVMTTNFLGGPLGAGAPDGPQLPNRCKTQALLCRPDCCQSTRQADDSGQ